MTVTPGATRDVPTGKPSAGPTDCATATVTAVPPTTKPETSPDATDGIGPETVPNTPDVPDGGGLVPDNDTTSVIFDSPTNVFDS